MNKMPGREEMAEEFCKEHGLIRLYQKQALDRLLARRDEMVIEFIIDQIDLGGIELSDAIDILRALKGKLR